MDKTEAFRFLMSYGSFEEPLSAKNFFFLQIPTGRIPWSRTIVPAVNLLVRSWFTPKQHREHLDRINRGSEALIYWQTDGVADECRLETISEKWTCYAWTREAGLIVAKAAVRSDEPAKASRPGP